MMLMVSYDVITGNLFKEKFMSTRPILIVDDDDAFRSFLTQQFGSTGSFHITEATTLSEAIAYLSDIRQQYDLILLDLKLPDGNGRDFCAKMREQGHMMPIIILTSASEDCDVVSCLNAGANDFISKPFRWNELLARLQSQLRLYDTSDNAIFTIGPFIFRPGAKLLIRLDTNRRINLTRKEVDIIKILYQHANREVPRDVLLEKVWGYYARATTHTLDTHIYRLRQKIETDPRNCRLLKSTTGSYRLDPSAV